MQKNANGTKPRQLQEKSGGFGTSESPKCIDEARERSAKAKRHRGLPVLTVSEFSGLYRTSSSDNVVRTFDFRGYVEKEDGGIMYVDVLAANILRGGIHIGINGITSYRNRDTRNDMMDGPEDVAEYDVYITIPGQTQRRGRVVCHMDTCMS